MAGSRTLILTSTYPADLSGPESNPRIQSRRRFVLLLHILGLVTSLIAVAVFAAAIPAWNKNFFHSTGPIRGDWTDGMPLAPLIFALLYHAFTLGHAQVRQARRSNVGGAIYASSLSRPSLIAHTLAPCLVLLSLFPALLLAAYGSLFRFWQPPERNQSGILICNMLNLFSRECEPILYDVGNLQIAGITFGIFVWISHFILSLISLRDMRRSRLAQQLQKEKMAQYGRNNESKTSHHRRRGYSLTRRSTNDQGARKHGGWHQNLHLDRYRGSGPDSSSNSNKSGSVSGVSKAASFLTDHRAQEVQQEVPVFFVQAPAASHPPALNRTEG